MKLIHAWDYVNLVFYYMLEDISSLLRNTSCFPSWRQFLTIQCNRSYSLGTTALANYFSFKTRELNSISLFWSLVFPRLFLACSYCFKTKDSFCMLYNKHPFAAWALCCTIHLSLSTKLTEFKIILRCQELTNFNKISNCICIKKLFWLNSKN